MNRIQLTLTASEYDALFDLAMDELRSIPDQARYLIREGLQNRGKLNLAEAEHKTSTKSIKAASYAIKKTPS